MDPNDVDFVLELLRLIAQEDRCSEIYWMETGGGLLRFYINCNDIFWWGCADGEEITPDNLHILRQSLKDNSMWGTLLFCARVRKMRPQGCAYPADKEVWPLFDECGPERPVEFGNPYDHPSKRKDNDDL